MKRALNLFGMRVTFSVERAAPATPRHTAPTVIDKREPTHSGNAALGASIRQFRKQQMRCDQGEFARLLGVSQAIVSQWETGKYMPSRMALLAIGRLDDSGSWAARFADDQRLAGGAR